MRIKNKYKSFGVKTKKKKQERSRITFNDIIIVGDDEEKAELIDIEEVPGSKRAGQTVLDAKGEFIYDVDFLIDAEAALAESVTAVEIVFYKSPPRNRKKPSGKSQKDIKSAIKRKKKRRNKTYESRETAGRPKLDPIIARAVVSLGEEFKESAALKVLLEKQNSKKRKIKRIAPVSEVSIKTIKLKEDSERRNIKVRKGGKNKIHKGMHHLKLKAPSGVATKKSHVKQSSKISKKTMLKMAQSKGHSLLSAGKSLHPVAPLFLSKSKDSSITKNKKKKSVHKSVRKFTVKQTKRGKSSAGSKIRPIKTSDNQFINAIQRSFITEKKTTRRLDREDHTGEIKLKTRMIPYSVSVGVGIKTAGLKENLTMRVRLIHDRKTPGTSKFYPVSHKSQVDELLTPDDAPEMSAGQNSKNPSVIRLRISQQDDIANSVKIFRRKITEDRQDPDYKFREIETIDVSAERGPILFTDRDVSNVHPVSYEYRAVPVGPSGSEAPEHTASIVVPGIKPAVGISVSRYADIDNNVAMSAMNMFDRVGVTIESIPDDVVAIRLVKESIVSDSFFSNSEVRFKPVIPVGTKTSIVNVGKGITSVTVEDEDVVPEQIYRYKCILRRPRHPEIEANEEEVIHYIKPRVRTPIEASITNLKLSGTTGEGYTVTFDLAADFSDPGLELLGEIFGASGVSGNFIEDIKKNRDQLQEVPAYLINRVDLLTGRSVSLGLFSPGKFKDDPKLQKKVKSQIVPGRKYKYIAKLSLRPPEAFFKKAVTSIDVQNRALLGLSETERYEVLAQRFLSGFGATSGLASETDLNKFSDMGLIGQFELGKTGIELDETITIPYPQATIQDIRVHPNKRENIVTWRVTGDPEDIDCYLVLLNYKGRRGIIGAVPSLRKFSFFRDKVYHRELGTLSYSIVPVFNNRTYGKIVESPPVVRDRDISDELLEKMIEKKESSKDRG